MDIKVKKLTKSCTLPAYQTDGAAGMDLHADLIDRPIGLLMKVNDTWVTRVYPDETLLIPCGFSIQVPEGYEAQVRSRSGLALKKMVVVANSPGTIDSDYRGEVGVLLRNEGTEAFYITHGDRIAQMVICPVVRAKLVEASELSDTIRKDGGFGSTAGCG